MNQMSRKMMIYKSMKNDGISEVQMRSGIKSIKPKIYCVWWCLTNVKALAKK